MQAAETLGKGYDDNYNAKNAAGMAALYASDGVLVSPGPVIHGTDNLKSTTSRASMPGPATT